MKLTPELESKFNDQIAMEFGAALVYRQLAIEADVQDLAGMAIWLRYQADEEILHANKFIDHVTDRGGHPLIGHVQAPHVPEQPTPVQIFQAALEHEQKVSESIRSLYRACDAAGDLDSRPLLNWFLEEQIEEEATVGEIVGRLERVGDDGAGLLRLDSDLGSRAPQSTEA